MGPTAWAVPFMGCIDCRIEPNESSSLPSASCSAEVCWHFQFLDRVVFGSIYLDLFIWIYLYCIVVSWSFSRLVPQGHCFDVLYSSSRNVSPRVAHRVCSLCWIMQSCSVYLRIGVSSVFTDEDAMWHGLVSPCVNTSDLITYFLFARRTPSSEKVQLFNRCFVVA